MTLSASTAFMPTFRYASERDVDVLVVEELFASREFVELFLVAGAPRFLERGIQNWDVKHSTGRQFSRREIDIRLYVTLNDDMKVCLLIENKLDTSEQPEQAESYLAECEELVQQKSFNFVACGLIAPESYLEKYPNFIRKFHFVISYEKLRDALTSRIARDLDLDEELVARLRHRADLLTQAVEKQRRGYTQIVIPEKAGFNAHYVALANAVAPKCLPGPQMLRADGNPAESVSMLFDAGGTFSNLPVDIRPRRFAHEFGRGQAHRANYVAVTFARWGAYLKILKEQFEADLDGTPYRLLAKVTAARPNPGLVVYEPTEAVDYSLGFEAEREKIENGILKANSLREWIEENQPVVRRWLDLVRKHQRT